jgi:hypothetical protein
VRFQVLMATSMKMIAFWDRAPSNLVKYTDIRTPKVKTT